MMTRTGNRLCRRFVISALMAGFTCLLSPVPALAEPDLKKLEGEYLRILPGFLNNDLEPVPGGGGNTLEIMPLSPASAYFHTLLYFPHGYQCETSGIANAEGNDLVYREPAAEGHPECVLRLHITRSRITFADKELSCRDTCGAHGIYDGEWFPRKSRKPIADPEEFKSSDDFTRAVEESQEADGKKKQQ